MNSALQERHMEQGWCYDEPLIGHPFLEVVFAHSSGRCKSTAWPNDYVFRPVRPDLNSNESSVVVNTDLARLASRYNIRINELHKFMRFPPVRAVIRTLLIELERPEAQPGPQLDEEGIINSVDESIRDSSASERQVLLTQPTTLGEEFADRSLVSCLVKLCSHFESWLFWDFGSCDGRSIVEVLVGVVGLFCNAWVHAPTIDVSWTRLSTPSLPASITHEAINDVESPRCPGLTPEIWFQWSLLYDPWIRRSHAAQLLSLDRDQDTKPIVIPALIAAVSQPEPEKAGRVVVKYQKKPEEERWAFKSILDSRWTGKTPRTGLQYLVDWEYAEPTWQPAKDLSGCDRWVVGFHRGNYGKPGPVSRLKRFL
ncbi:hypothetical protein ColKHC_05873 [Colletotrichum higginsianum]|nr:hypothetical protein CH35J_008467 [Colletotrichum higginsianum]GJC97047.1 hypothetical protein ColKHC_05873 [Colletotrichum higginsianum]